MKVEISGDEEGFILIAAKYGWRDVAINVNNEVFYAQYHILVNKNVNMIDILNGCSIENQLVCPNFITRDAVELMLKYYGGAAIDIDLNNVLDLLVICLEWKEEKLANICLNYLKHHINNDIIVDLFNKIKPFEDVIISYVLNEFMLFLRTNSYYLLYTDLLYKLPYIALDYITQIPNLVIPSESSLVNRLIEHYKNYIQQAPLSTEKFQQILKKVLININWNSIAIVDIDGLVFELFGNINTLLEESNKIDIQRIYYTPPPEIDNDKILSLLIKYYSEDPLPLSVDYDDKLDLMNNSIKPYLEILLSTDDIKQILVTLLFIVDLGQSLSIDKTLHNRIFDHLVHQYNRSDENTKKVIAKCLIVLIRSRSSLHALTELLEVTILDEILNFSDYIPDDICQMIIRFKTEPMHLLLNADPSSSDLYLSSSQSPTYNPNVIQSPNMILKEEEEKQQLSPLHIPSYSSSQSSSQRTPPQLPPSSPYSNSSRRSSTASKRNSMKVKKEKSLTPPVKRESQSNRTSPYETRSKKKIKLEESPSVEKNKKSKRDRSISNSSSKGNVNRKTKPLVKSSTYHTRSSNSNNNNNSNNRNKLKTKPRNIRLSSQSSDFESDGEDDEDNDNDGSDSSVVTIHSDEELLEMQRAANISENRSINSYTNPKPLTVFKYDKSHYSLFTDQEFRITPDYDGDDCVFSITPPFPEYISFNKTNGEIEGKCPNASDSITYDITCSNSTNTLHFKLSLDVKLVTFRFCEECKSDNLELSKGGTYVTSLSTNEDNCTISHCFVNTEMRRGIYHITYQSFTPLVVLFGATTNNSLSDPRMHDKRNSWTIDIHKNGVILYGKNQCQTPKWKAVKNAIYEMIYNMENKTISIKLPDGTITELFKHVGTPLYPFVGLFYKHSAVKLVSVECER